MGFSLGALSLQRVASDEVVDSLCNLIDSIFVGVLSQINTLRSIISELLTYQFGLFRLDIILDVVVASIWTFV